jgi:hypothetical protein
MKKQLLITVLAATLLGGCVASGPSVGDYAIGDDSAAIKGGRNKASAQLTKAELDQHRRQRTNVSEELDLEKQKRRNSQEKVNGGLNTATGVLGVLGAAVHAFR